MCARSVVTKQKIIDAALACYEDIGVENSTMESVAQRAGVGRATLYRHFANQDEMLTEVILFEISDMRTKLQQLKQTPDTLEAYIVEACMIVLIESPKKPITSYLFSDEASPIVSRLALTNNLLIEFGENLVAPIFEAAKKQDRLRDGVSLERMIEWITRFMISYLTNPSPLFKTKSQKRELIQHFLLPVLLK